MFGKLFDDFSESREFLSEDEILDLRAMQLLNTKIEDFGEGRAAFKCLDCGYSYPRLDCLIELRADNVFYEEFNKGGSSTIANDAQIGGLAPVPKADNYAASKVK